MKKKYSPIALIVYNRPDTLKKTIKSLEKNKEIKKAEIYIFSDGPKKEILDKKRVNKVRSVINNIKNLNIKKKFFYNQNRGLKKNILGAINYVFKKNSKIIVVEDDLVFSTQFYLYMNNALNFIENKKNIWHVSAWNYPINVPKSSKNLTFLWKNMNCWGWGTHKKYWKKIILSSDFFIKNFSKKRIKDFDLDGELNNWGQILKNKKNIIQSWAIFWNASIFWQKGLCLNPVISFSKNIGFSNKSTNTKEIIPQPLKLNYSSNLVFPKKAVISPYYTNKVKKHLNTVRKIKKFKSIQKSIYRLFSKNNKST